MDSNQFIRPYRMLSILLLAQRYVKETNSTIINDILSQISFPEEFFGANSQSTHRAKGLDFTINPIRCLFLTPLFVAFAPLCLPYILRRKTQGRRLNTIHLIR